MSHGRVRDVCVPLLMMVSLAFLGWHAGRSLGVSSERSHDSHLTLPEPLHQSATEASSLGAHQNTEKASIRELDQIFSTGAIEAQRHQLYEVAARLASAEFPAALAALRRNGEGKDSDLYDDLAAFWFERDLPAAKAWLTTLPPEEREKIFAAVLTTWAAIDLTDVFNWIRSLPSDEGTTLASSNRNNLARLLAKSDPAAASDFLIATPQRSADFLIATPQSGEEAVFSEWGRRDPYAASKRIGDLASEQRIRAAIGLISGWVEQSPKDVEAWISTLDDAPLLREASKCYISERSKRNPEAAAAYMMAHWIPQFQEDGYMSAVLSDWLKKDEASALSWAKALPDADARNDALYNLLTSVDDPQHAAELWVSEFGDGAREMGWSSARYIARGLAMNIGFDAAADFLTKVPERDRALTIDQFIRECVPITGAVDIAEAVLRQPAGTIRNEMIQPAFKTLAAEGQVSEACQLLEKITAAPERQVAITALIDGEVARNPDRAFQLAISLAGATDGRRIVIEELSRTYKERKNELQEWLQNTQLITPEEKARVLNRTKSSSR